MDALYTFGPDSRMSQTIEECAELIVEINKIRHGQGSVEAVAGEIADVTIVLMQMCFMFPGVPEIVQQKLERLARTIETAKRGKKVDRTDVI
jgi:NTP pyrophosphatase (non-canonical NTP hydrolase)